MLVLALDTTTRSGSAAIVSDGRLLASASGDPARTHAERLPGDLLRLLDQVGYRPGAFDVFAVAAGPGSFTGLRVGIATVQGLAFALGKPVVPLPVLDVLAQVGAGWPDAAAGAPASAGTTIGVAMDAQRREVFSALFRIVEPAGAEPAVLEVVEPPAAEPPAATAERWARRPFAAPLVLVGDAAPGLAQLVRGATGEAGLVVVREPVPPLAPLLGLLAERAAKAGRAVAPHAVRPIYVRRPDAELARDRKTPTEQPGAGDPPAAGPTVPGRERS